MKLPRMRFRASLFLGLVVVLITMNKAQAQLTLCELLLATPTDSEIEAMGVVWPAYNKIRKIPIDSPKMARREEAYFWWGKTFGLDFEEAFALEWLYKWGAGARGINSMLYAGSYSLGHYHNNYVHGVVVPPYSDEIYKAYSAAAKFLYRGMLKIPVFTGTVYRWTITQNVGPNKENIFTDDSIHTWTTPAFLSTTKRASAIGFRDLPITLESAENSDRNLYIIHSKTCRNISYYSGTRPCEEEVLCLPGTKFKIIGRGKNAIEMEEI